MKQKTSLNIKKRVLASITISALALATVAGAVNFGTIADATRGVLDNTAEYGEQLKDYAPGDLNLSELQDSSDTWYWVDSPNTYFGKPGNQEFVVANADLNNGETPTAYKEVTVPVQKRSVAPVVKQGTISGTAANYTTSAKASIGAYKRTITVTAGEGGTVAGSGTYVIGESVTLTAAPAEGYKFTGWSDGNNSSSRTITVNDNATYTATFESDSMKVTSKLPIKIGDISIMTIKQAYVALGGTTNSSETQYDPTKGYNSSTYYMYAINDTAMTNDSALSTPDNLKAVGHDWYKELNKPTTVDNHWTNAGAGTHSVFGGPLNSVIRSANNDTYSFLWNYSESGGYHSGDACYWLSYVSGSTYVAVVRANSTITVTSSLPTIPGNTSIMTLEQVYAVIRDSENPVGYKWDPSPYSVGGSTYYIYAINDTPMTNDSALSTPDNLKAVGADWYNQLNKPTTNDSHWDVGNHKVFGGALNYLNHDKDKYRFDWQVDCWGGGSAGLTYYWYVGVPGSVCVAIVRAK